MASPLSLPAKSTPTTSLSSPSSPSSSRPSPPRSRSQSPPLEPSTSTASHPLPLLPPLHLAARRNDLPHLHRLFPHSPDPQSDQELVNQHDHQGITPLHWAAINGHLLFAKELLKRGAVVDQRGGELRGTPLHWAARNGHLPLVHLLLSHSSDPTLADSQSFTTLHLTVHSSSAFLLAYLLHTLQPISLETPDSEGHTALSWAAYQGDAISVELLLAAGADPNREDNAGLRPLHWAVTKGNAECIRRLVAAGADLTARTLPPPVPEDGEEEYVPEGVPRPDPAPGKTARDMAIELKSLAAYNRGLSSAGFDTITGRREDLPLSPRTTERAIFASMAVGMGVVFWTLSATPWFVGILLGAAECFGVHHFVSRVLLGVKGGGGGGHSHGAGGGGLGHGHGHGGGGGGEKLTKSPYLCAIIASSLGWCGWVWGTRYVLLPGYTISNVLFFFFLVTCSYSFFRAVTMDPGTVRREKTGAEGEAELKETIEELVESGQFNGMNFCLTCLVRRPLRSKHSYATGRCVARFDHYCPWVWNDIGLNNHRQFLIFIGSLVAGVMLFAHLTFSYFYERAPDLPPESSPEYSCPPLSPTFLCMATSYDSFALFVALWASLQLTWTVVLLGVQLWQVTKQLTTLEVSNVSRFGYLGGKPGVSGAAQQGYVAKWEASQGQAAQHAANLGGGAGDGAENEADDPDSLAHAPSSSRPTTPLASSSSAGARPTGSFAFLLKLLGLDRFLSSSSSSSRTPNRTVSTVSNPFSLSPSQNCLDFWTRGGELGVDYERVYEVPKGGWKRVVAERKRREREEKARGAGGNKGGGGTVRREGGRYERVALEDV